MEPLRAGVDALSIRMLDRLLHPTHFRTHAGEGCRLTQEGRSLYYPMWASARNTWLVYDGRATDPERPRSLRSQCLREVKRVRGQLPAEHPQDPT